MPGKLSLCVLIQASCEVLGTEPSSSHKPSESRPAPGEKATSPPTSCPWYQLMSSFSTSASLPNCEAGTERTQVARLHRRWSEMEQLEGRKNIHLFAYKVQLGLQPFRGNGCGSPPCHSSKIEPFSSKCSSRIHLKPPIVAWRLLGLERRSWRLLRGLLLPQVAFGDSASLLGYSR